MVEVHRKIENGIQGFGTGVKEDAKNTGKGVGKASAPVEACCFSEWALGMASCTVAEMWEVAPSVPWMRLQDHVDTSRARVVEQASVHNFR